MTNHPPVISAIPTTHNGVTFRSRMEARWSVFLSGLGINWQFEPEGYVLPNGRRYLPDFWLPDLMDGGMFLEVKPDSSLGSAAAEDLAKLTSRPVAVTDGNAFDMAEVPICFPFPDGVSWDGYGFIRCASCGRATLSYCGTCSRHEYKTCTAVRKSYDLTGVDLVDTLASPERAHAQAMAFRFWDPAR